MEALLRDEARWRQLLVRESRDPIVILDEDAKVFEANRRFAEMLGYSEEEVSALHAWDWDAVYDKEQIQRLAKSVDAGGHHFETQHRRKDGALIDVELSNNGAMYRGHKLILCICRDITGKKRAEKQREELIARLRESLAEIKTLRGIVPVCCICKKVRDDEGYWEQVDIYLSKHSSAEISHGVCPECVKEHYPELAE